MITILSKHDNLKDFGTEFNVVPYEGKDGWFKLIGENQPEDDIIEVPEEIIDPEESDFDESVNIIDESNDVDNFDLDL